MNKKIKIMTQLVKMFNTKNHLPKNGFLVLKIQNPLIYSFQRHRRAYILSEVLVILLLSLPLPNCVNILVNFPFPNNKLVKYYKCKDKMYSYHKNFRTGFWVTD